MTASETTEAKEAVGNGANKQSNGPRTIFEDAPLAVEASNITVKFRSYTDRPTTLKEMVLGFMRGRHRYYSTFNALDGVSFKVRKGEIFGILGSNGAGKSTLLRVLAGLLKPTDGEVSVKGSVDSLISLGAGFDAELNAIENIYLNGALHKKSHDEIKERIPHILEFAELTEFAHKPIKYYSSGMFARLGFSVAIERNPDILLVDEILGVGDERFQAKSRKVFDRFIEEKKTIIIVSHSLGVFREMVHQACLMSRGKIVFCGDPLAAIEKYQDPSYQTALT